MKDAVPLGIVVLILTLLLVASGCSTTQPALIASPDFVEENLPRLIALEKRFGELRARVKLMARFAGPAIMGLSEDYDKLRDEHWVYYQAAHVYLVSGDLDRYTQAVAKADDVLQKLDDLFAAFLAEPSEPAPEPEKTNGASPIGGGDDWITPGGGFDGVDGGVPSIGDSDTT